MFKDNNFIRTAAAVPVTEIGNTEYNIKEIKKAAGEKLKEELNQPLKEIASLKARIEKKKRPRRFFKKSSA